MNRFTVFFVLITSLTLFGCSSNPEAVERTEAAEDLEESAGDEAELIGDNPDDMDGWDPAGGEIEAEMEAEPYPE